MYAVLCECTSVVSPSEVEVLTETSLGKGKYKAVFRSRLQTLNEQNANGRVYDLEIGRLIVEQLKPKAVGRSLLMEVDHPMFVSSDPEILKRRATVVEIQNAGAVLREVYLQGQEICGVVETLSGFRGPDLAALVLRDRVPVGFSLRALGTLEETGGILRVKQPFRAITYDVVSNPSHATAKILEFVPESAQSWQGQSLIQESDLSALAEDGVRVHEDFRVVDFFQDVFETEFLKTVTRRIIFKI